MIFQRLHFMDFLASGLSAMCRPRNLESNAFIDIEICEKLKFDEKLWKCEILGEKWQEENMKNCCFGVNFQDL